MEIQNATKLPASYTMGMDPDGRERLVVVIKGTFDISDAGGELQLASEQAKPIFADVFSGEPGLSSVIYESDFAPFKPRCDVLLNGCAHAPGGQRAPAVRVSLSFAGAFEKTLDVYGDRVWRSGLLVTEPSDPVPFDSMPINYDRAFGGVDVDPDRPDLSRSFAENPVGRGYYPLSSGRALDGKPLPNTCEKGRPIVRRTGTFRPASFGVVGRSFASRAKLAGTYDAAWLEKHFPFLPPDFDPRYFQAAPPDQQVEYPRGGEAIVLRNLTPAGKTVFVLPRIEIPVEFISLENEANSVDAVLDTIVIEPELGRVQLTWRASLPLRKNIFEIGSVVVGRMSPAYYRARELGKTYYPSIGALARATGGGLSDADSDGEDEPMGDDAGDET
jgi:hypothetical protein